MFIILDSFYNIYSISYNIWLLSVIKRRLPEVECDDHFKFYYS
jgi:hypothetical protein